MTNNDSELISILVPKQYLQEIYGFISTLGASTTLGAHGEEIKWPTALIGRQYDESPDIIKRLQKILAAQPGKKFYTSELAVKLKAPKGSKSVAGALGAYGRRVLNRYKMTTWPIATAWDHEKREQTFWMEPNVAAVIKSRPS